MIYNDRPPIQDSEPYSPEQEGEEQEVPWTSDEEDEEQEALWWEPTAPPPHRLYWRERFPVERFRLEVSRQALDQLRSKHISQPDSQAYPWRLGLNPGTGLPAFLRTWLSGPLDEDEAEARRKAQGLLTETIHSQTIFGIQMDAGLSEEFVPGPVIKLGSQEGGQHTRDVRHFTWRQVRNGVPVIGGSVRVHGVVGDKRVAVTSSYFPIPSWRSFAPCISQDLAKWRALQAVIRAIPAGERRPFLAGLIQQFLALGNSERLSHFVALLLALMDDTPGRWLIALADWLLQRAPTLTPLVTVLLLLIWQLLGLEKEAASAEIVPIGGSDQAILPFDGSYHLISRVRILPPDGDAWYVDVDMESGEVLGEPWQAVVRAPTYYKNSGEAADEMPTGDATTVNAGELARYLDWTDASTGVSASSQPSLTARSVSIETTTVAAHAQRLYRYLRDTCGVAESQLQGYTYTDENGNPQTQSPGLRTYVNSTTATGFSYDEHLHPKRVRFQRDDGSGIPEGDQMVYAPARDPEVVMHELTHGFLWLLNPDPWDTPPTLGPFGRALQEGYAMYLSRSVAAADDSSEAQQPWARAAYPPQHANGSENWGDRWLFARAKKEEGADLLPAPNTYPVGKYSPQSIQVYDVGMVWARALWDLRQLLGPELTDRLVIQAYPYLHGYIANFELAAEGLLQADIQLTTVNLANGTQPIWAGRGIAAGQGVHGFAQASDGTLIAACDAGILRSTNQGASWTLERENLSPRGTLTGVVAVASDGNVLYAAAQLPPNSAAGVNTQWDPGVFQRDISTSGSRWQAIPGWPDDATPLSLLVVASGVLMIGSSRGVYTWNRSTGTWVFPTSDSRFNALNLAVVTAASGAQRVRACSPTDLYQYRWQGPPTSLTTEWTPAPANLFGSDQTVRLTAAAVRQQDELFVGSLNGLWRVALNWDTNRISRISTSVLALAANGSRLYLATPDEVLMTDDGTQFTSLSLPGNGVTVISLLATGTYLLAGTLADGIWRHDGHSWAQVYTPPGLDSIEIKAGGKALLSFTQPADHPGCRINLPEAAGVTLKAVAQPGFPLRLIEPNANGTYPLTRGTGILLLENTRAAADVTLHVTISADGSSVNLSV